MASTFPHTIQNSGDPSHLRYEVLKRLAHAINAHTSQQQTLDEALKIVAQTLGVEKCLVLHHNARLNQLEPLIPAYGIETNQIEKVKIKLSLEPELSATQDDNGLSMLKNVLLSNRPLLSNEALVFNFFDNSPDSPFESESIQYLKVKNLLIVPVRFEGKTHSLCCAADKIEGEFNEQDLESLAEFASLMATILKNLNLINRLEGEQRRHLAVLDATIDGFIEVGRDYKITVFSKGAESLTGWTAEKALGRTCSEVLLPHSPSGSQLCTTCPLRRSFLQGISTLNVETLIRTYEGEDNWVTTSYNVVSGEQGEVVSGVIAIKDIYRIKALGDELRQQIQQQQSLLGVINVINGLGNIEEIYSKALSEVANAINFDLGVIHSVTDESELKLIAIHQPDPVSYRGSPNQNSNFLPIPDEDIKLPNPIAHFDFLANHETMYRYRDWTHWTKRAVKSQAVQNGSNFSFQSNKTIDSCEALRQNEPYLAVNEPEKPVCTVIGDFEGIQSHLCVPIKGNNNCYGVLHLASYQPYAFWGSDFALALSICKQIAIAAERASLFQQIDTLARTDALTKLYNKREFWERMDREIKLSARSKRPLSLIIIDLDRLKWYNDCFGHAYGDHLLIKLSQLILEKCRSSDIAFRFGGDELCLLLPDTRIEEAYNVAERIRLGTIDLQAPSNQEVRWAEEADYLQNKVTMSVGIASFPEDAANATGLFEKADMAMYRAKESGKNRTVIYDVKIDSNRTKARKKIQLSKYVDERLLPIPPKTGS